MRRFQETRRADIKYTRRPGAYGVIALGGQLLLTHQNLAKPEIQLPGGGIDPGESPVRALHREVFEETGYRISEIRRVGAYQRFTFIEEYDLWAHKICHIFLCRPTLRISDPVEPEHTVLWLNPYEAYAQLTNQGDAEFVRRIFG